jgi:hypothetical protein
MKLCEIITKAQVLSGVGVFEGNSVDENMMATCLSVFHDTLNDVNNDPRVTLVQKELNYQTYSEGVVPPASNPGNGSWVDAIPPIDAPEPSQDVPETLFPGVTVLPFAITNEYPLPKDCRRVLKVVSRNVELRKTDFSEIIKGRSAIGFMNMFSVNNNAIQLVRQAPAILIYAKEFPEYMPQDEVEIPGFALSYLVNLTAYNIALHFNQSAAERCLLMAEKSHKSLLANLAVNAGTKYVNSFTALNRFDDGFATGVWL